MLFDEDWFAGLADRPRTGQWVDVVMDDFYHGQDIS